MKIYCRQCQERIVRRDGEWQLAIRVDYLNKTECRATGGEHVPR